MQPFDPCAAVRRFLKKAESYNLTFLPSVYTDKHRPDIAAPEELLLDILSSVFGESVLNWLQHLSQNIQDVEWYIFRHASDRSPFDPKDEPYIAATSLDKCIAYFLERSFATFIDYTELKLTHDGKWEFYNEDGVFSSIERIQFETVLEEDRRRAATALKGHLRHGSKHELVESLNNHVYGFNCYCETLTPPNNDHQPLHISPNNLCSALLGVSKKIFSDTLPRHIAQELTSTYLGFESWQHLKAAEKENISESPYFLCFEDENEPQLTIQYKYYLGLPSAVYAYGQHLKTSPIKHIDISSQPLFIINNRSMINRVKHPHAFSKYNESTGYMLSEVPLSVVRDSLYLELARRVLDSSDPVKEIQTILCLGQDIKSRVLELNQKRGISPAKQVFLSGYAFWCEENENQNQIFRARQLDEIGKWVISNYSRDHGKAKLVKDCYGDYSLAADWIDLPENRLSISHEDAKLIADKLDIGLSDGQSSGHPKNDMKEIIESKYFKCPDCGDLVMRLIFVTDADSFQNIRDAAIKYFDLYKNDRFDVYLVGPPLDPADDDCDHLHFQVRPFIRSPYKSPASRFNNEIKITERRHCSVLRHFGLKRSRNNVW